MKNRSKRWRPSPTAAVVGTVVVLALGGGAAFAKSHFIITSTSQIKPSVLKALHGAKGAKGATGATGVAGKNGTNGTNGGTGPQGPGASVLALELFSPGASGTATSSAAVGTLPIQLSCTNEGSSSPRADLLVAANSEGSRQGRFDETWVVPAVATSGTQPTVFQSNGTFPLLGSTDLINLANGSDVEDGTIYLYEPVGASGTVTETVNFELTVAGTNAGSACGVSAQIVASA